MRAGLDDVGIGALFGLADYRFEVLAMLQHANHLEKEYGAGVEKGYGAGVEKEYGAGVERAETLQWS